MSLIEVKNVYKTYKVKENFLRSIFIKKRKYDYVHAIKNFSASIKKNEVVGIIGDNGAGKTTLLRLIAGIASTTQGSIVLKSHNIRCLLDLSVGLKLRLTGIQNIYHLLSFYGFSRRQIMDQLDQIVEFSELGEAIYDSVSTYSSGMRVRLAFAINFAFPADIYIIDEILAVGDEFFAAKSFKKIREIVQSGATCLIASHDWRSIFRLATRIIWMQQGQICMDGSPVDVMYPFLKKSNAYKINNKAKILSVNLFNELHEEISAIMSGATLIMQVAYKNYSQVVDIGVIVGFMALNTGESVISAWSLDSQFVLNKGKNEIGVFEIYFSSLPLAKGNYDIMIYLVDSNFGPFASEYLDIFGKITSLQNKIELEVMDDNNASNALLSTRLFPNLCVKESLLYADSIG